MNINFDKTSEILKILNIGKSFRIFGDLSLLISLWNSNELTIKISLITFIFGAFARILEMVNKSKKIRDNILLQATF
ncbi:hypothetical protein GYA19_05135 [Candidatus Beckwithbacteria bacterium]|nr:hypothetical protein [Candidatus Beckwithbacteria bacterium]